MSIANKLAEERRARLAAERLLELKQAELFAANRKLGRRAKALSDEIVETRAEITTVRDENQRVKSDLTVAHQKIELVEQRLWHSIETIHDGFAMFDIDNGMVMANRAYLSVFDGLEEIGPGVSYARILQLLTEEGIVNVGQHTAAEWRATMMQRWQSRDPSPVVIRLWNDEYIRLIDRRGHGGDVVSLALNITDTVKYEKAIKAEQKNAEAANRAKSAFLTNMSHEIRTPMNGVVGMADLLTETVLDDEQRLFVDTIKGSAEALLVIINDVLDFSKIEADKIVLHPEPFDLERCIHEILVMLQGKAREKSIELVMDYDMFLPSQFIGDPGRLRQVLTNLIGNALKFTLQGHVLVRVVGVETGDGKTDIRITIEDTGIGIPQDKLTHIFGEFNQVDDERNRQFEGTGLGLAISKRLITLMGGKIWVESEVGTGTCFGFNVTLANADHDTSDVPDISDRFHRVIIADGHLVTLDILARQFAAFGIQTTQCTSLCAFKDVVNPSYDLFLCGSGFDDADPFDLVEYAHDTHPNMSCVMISATASDVRNDPIGHHIKTVVPKPMSRRGILNSLINMHSNQPMSTQAAEPIFTTVSKRQEQRTLRILTAEDNKTNQLVFSKMVKSLDIELRFANNGEDAIKEYETFQPDLIFMDISMPKMDGKDACRAIRNQERTKGLPPVPIIALTAHAINGDKDEILSVGMDRYLTKPLKKDEILTAIADFTPKNVKSAQA